MILHVLTFELSGPHSLRLQFSDGTSKSIDLLPLLNGPMFEPLRDPIYFAQVALDTTCGTLVWPNGADFAPEALRNLPPKDEPQSAGKAA